MVATLYMHRSALGLNPTVRGRAAGSLPVQKAQTSDRASSCVKNMGLGIDSHLSLVRVSVGLENLRRAGGLGGCGFMLRGSVSTKVVGRKLVADRNLQEAHGLNDSLKGNSEAGLEIPLVEANAMNLGSVSREAEDIAGTMVFSTSEELPSSSTSGSSDKAISNSIGNASVEEEFTSQMTLGASDSFLEGFSGGSGIRNVWGLPVDEGVAIGLGASMGRQMAVRTSSEHKLRAMSKGAVEIVDTESGSSEVEGEVLDRVEKLRQVIADYSYQYHSLDNPVVR